MKISIISFTEQGIQLSKTIADDIGEAECVLYTKCSTYTGDRRQLHMVDKNIGAWAKEQFKERSAMVFIGACGIAVRAVAPFLSDKRTDSPVLVMDERGEHVIPILSGHLGGGNELAAFLAKITGAEPVITTATDINHQFAVDMFAKANGLTVVNKNGIAKVSAKVLAGKRITMSVEAGHMEPDCKWPEGIQPVPYPPMQYADVVITSQEIEEAAAIFLRPKEYIIGIGCRKGKEAEKIEIFIRSNLQRAGIALSQIAGVASIDSKKDEQGILAWCRKEKLPFCTYTAEELMAVEGSFSRSEFVKQQVGADNVCERAAERMCGPQGELVYKKHAEDGMTVAIAKRTWSVRFDEE